MRHVTDADLDALEPLLVRLRALGVLQERRRGNFQVRSRAFLHFHADGDDFYADIRLVGADFERHRVTTAEEQDALVLAIASCLPAPR